MGGETSLPQDGVELAKSIDYDHQLLSDTVEGALSSVDQYHKNQLLSTAFASTWSNILPNSITPPPRYGQFTAYFPDYDCVVMGYGIGEEDVLYNDIWLYNLAENKWREVKFDVKNITPRTNAVSVIKDEKIWVFGGFSNNVYLDDLHVINMANNTIETPDIKSTDKPCGRIGHVFAIKGNNIMLWGGYNGNWLSDCWILDITTLVWRQIPCSHIGRTSPAFCSTETGVYIYGSTKSVPMLYFDWETEQLSPVSATGNEPEPSVSGAGLVNLGPYLVLVGGSVPKSNYSFLYAFDIKSKWWFTFHVVPDNKTTSQVDGKVEIKGMFMVPRISRACVIYDIRRRRIVTFLGKPMANPPSASFIDTAEALAFLNHQADMLRQIRDQNQKP